MKTRVLHKVRILLAGAAMIFTLGSCVDKDNNSCNNSLRVIYDYNIDRVNKFHVQASNLNVYVFDSATGLFVQEIDCPNAPYGEDFTIEIPLSLNGKAYDYVVWSGLESGAYNFPQLQAGVSTKSDLNVQVKGYEQQLVNNELPPLWHGLSERVTMPVSGSQTHTISLTKNTNKFRIAFSFVSNGEIVQPYDPSKLEVGIYSASSWYGNDNSVLDDAGREVKYVSYLEEEENAGLLFEINTLRLMAGRENTLVVRDIENNREIFRMPLNSYLNLLRLMEESWIETLQEYLDREDVFKIMIFINNDGGNWTSFRILINDWVVREHNL